jgi:glycosyltransferase involved in cell wall biosynthesis
MINNKNKLIGNQHVKGSPFFTIVTASLNNEATIEQTLRSTKNQTFQDFEHIVIDGVSTDGTLRILEQFKNSYRISWIVEPDQGIAEALNKGIRQSKGRYIIIIQADDSLLHSKVLSQIYPYLRNEKVDILSFPVVLDHPTKGKILRKPIRRLWWNHFKLIFPHQGCFVHKRVFEKIGNFRTEFKIGMDYDFFYRALACKTSVRFEKIPVALMGGTGIGSASKFLYKRLKEERLVQIQNERNQGWRMAQFFFRLLYMPYKKYLMMSTDNNASGYN